MYIRYLFFFILFPLIVIVGEYLIYVLFNRLNLFQFSYIKNTFVVFGILFPIMFLGAMTYGIKHFSVLNSWFYTIGGIWLSLLNYIVVITLIAALLMLLNNFLNFNIPVQGIMFALIAIVFILIPYGTYKANNPKIVRFEIKSEALAPLWKDKKILVVSDIHLGETRREKFMQKIVDLINSEKPDIVFNLGDLIDGPSFPYAKAFAPLADLNPPLGNYYVEGNHEGYSGEYDVFKENFPKNLNDITSSKAIVNGTQIIGLPFSMDRTRDVLKKELELISYDKTKPSIILLHDPKETPILAENNASLVLSGHTHDGQFFPFTMIVKQIYGKYAHGVVYTNNTASVTSSGVGTAVSPIRINTEAEILVLQIK